MILTALALCVPLQEEAVAVASTVDAVTVYADRALVTRTSVVEITEGLTSVLFEGLPEHLRPDTVEVKVTGGAKVAGIDTRLNVDTKAASAAVELARQRRRSLTAGLEAARDRVGTLDQLRKALLAIDVKPPEAGAGLDPVAGLDPGVWEAGLAFILERLEATASNRREAQMEVDALRTEIRALDQALQVEVEGAVVRTRQVEVMVASGGSGLARVEVTYLVPGASWRPSYDLRASEDLAGVALTAHAVIRQSTGEDWEDAALTVSTAQPHLGASPPPLPVRRLWIAEPVVVAKEVSSERPRAPMRQLESLGFPEMELMDAEVTTDGDEFFAYGNERRMPSEAFKSSSMASVTRTGITSQFLVPRREDVPSDGEEHRVFLGEAELTVEPSRFTVPRRGERAYLKAKTTNSTDMPLVAGEARVFLGPDYVGTTAVNDLQEGQSFDLFLGVDPAVVVERRLVSEKRREASFFARRESTTYIYETKVSYHGEAGPVVVHMEDIVPVSDTDTIVVRLVETSPPHLGGEAELKRLKEEGVLAWEIPLEAGETRVVRLEFKVEYDKDASVGGFEK